MTRRLHFCRYRKLCSASLPVIYHSFVGMATEGSPCPLLTCCYLAPWCRDTRIYTQPPTHAHAHTRTPSHPHTLTTSHLHTHTPTPNIITTSSNLVMHRNNAGIFTCQNDGNDNYGLLRCRCWKLAQGSERTCTHASAPAPTPELIMHLERLPTIHLHLAFKFSPLGLGLEVPARLSRTKSMMIQCRIREYVLCIRCRVSPAHCNSGHFSTFCSHPGHM